MTDVSRLATTDELPSYDETFWPVLVVKMPPVALSATAFATHLDRLSALHDRGTTFGLLIDMGKHPPLSPLQRKLIAARIKDDTRRAPGVMRGCGLVVASAFERGVVTAINWVAQPLSPFRAFATRAEALDWLRELVAARR